MKIKCSNCDEEHDIAQMALVYKEPIQWHWISDADRAASELTPDLCIIRSAPDTWYFIRGVLSIPIQNSTNVYEWGVWTSLSEQSYNEVVAHWDDPARIHTGPHVGYFSNKLPYYPDTLSMIARVHHREPSFRPWVELKPVDHPLSIHQREGISTEELQKIIALIYHPN